jgi:cytidine deaminase
VTHTPEELLAEAAAAAERAYCPYSEYPVGAAIAAVDGTVFRGCNVENASLGLTVCAERSALFAAVAGGHREFAALAVVTPGEQPAPPCGACRQALSEFCDENIAIYAAAANSLQQYRTLRLGALLPMAFHREGARPPTKEGRTPCP